MFFFGWKIDKEKNIVNLHVFYYFSLFFSDGKKIASIILALRLRL